MSSAVITNQMAVFSISSDESTLSNASEDAVKEGLSNQAFSVSISDLPNSVFQDLEAEMPKIRCSRVPTEEITGLGLGPPSSFTGSSAGSSVRSSIDEGTIPCQMLCLSHNIPKPAKYICVRCLMLVCEICQRVHHRPHKVISLADNLKLSENQDLREAYEDCITKRKGYKKALSQQMMRLDIQLTETLERMDSVYDKLINRVNEKRHASALNMKAAVSAQRQALTEKLNSNQKIIDSCNKIVKSGVWTPENNPTNPKGPMSLLVPRLDVTLQGEIEVPIAEFKCKTAFKSTTPLLEDTTHFKMQLIKAVGTKGERMLQFRLPGGVCIDTENTVYVADEGNNRIQRINNDGKCLGTFTWGNTDTYVTDVAFDPHSERLVVPRATSENGLLKCSTFSYVTLDGTEVSRFTVPSMKGGVLISANRQGHLIISDVVKSSVFIIIDSHVHLEIKDQEFLKAPAHAVMGLNGEILVVDSLRCAVAVFDKNGVYIRDIGSTGELKKPSGLAIDRSCGVIAVTDWSGDQIILFSYTGSRIGSIGGFKCPHSVAINDNHRMVVTDCWNNQVKVFSYDATE